MVSIPDWARFTQLSDNKQHNAQHLLNKFYKQKETEVIKQAEEYGYFFHPTKEALFAHCENQNPQRKDIDTFKLVCLTGVHLRSLGDVGVCSNLTICLLANNFIAKFDSLRNCRQLIKLDLHSNQVSSIPGSSFWSVLRKLHTLYLHDNPLGHFETLQILGSSPCLSILTLHDTPLSLKKNYRHHVVNSILTLKALDHHVISDEEIIEDAVFSGRFTSLGPSFKIDLCPETPQDTTFSLEMATFRAVISKVNTILAKHSPVLIVQRYLRGYLTRRRLGIIKKPMILKLGEIMPPPGTPVLQTNSVRTTLSGENIDYDTYMKNRRPGSIVPEETFRSLYSVTAPSLSEEGPVVINLKKLESGTLLSLQADNVAMETVMAQLEGTGLMHSQSKDKHLKMKEEISDERPKPRTIKDIRQFFGPVVPVHDPSDTEEWDTAKTGFRLTGRKPKFVIADATAEMILSRKAAGQMVRDAETDRMTKELIKPKVKVRPYSSLTNEQRLFNRAQGTMALSCLMAVHKAYKQREKAEKSAAKIENNLGMREERLRARDRIYMYHEQRRAQILKSRDIERSQIVEQLEKRELQRLNSLDKQQECKVRSADISKLSKANQAFMQEFNSQHTSVSNALLRHDRQAKWEDTRTHKKNKVANAKLTEIEQLDVVKNYLEHRQLMRQTETAVARAALHAKMLAEANERIMDARNRVAQQRACQATIQALYPVLPSTIPLSSSAPAGMSRWQGSTTMSEGSRHNHTLHNFQSIALN
ncbi:unnamed protein product [Lymnaea stagnalis]|uniref:Leucine-rich repeat and IQ domain-containing protein 3 n=1 Tax=Lymnaea stagnalis TaxID=6523 RepID=A0AAV2IIN7_LYMST